MSTDDQLPTDDLEALRALILGSDAAALRLVQEIKVRLEDVEELVRTDPVVAERVRGVLGEVLHGLEGDERRLVQDRLTALLLTNIQSEINAAKPRFIQAVHPFAGELVRKGIQQAISELMELIEERLREPATLYKRAQIRLESMITRKPVAEIWLHRKGLFNVERILLVDRASGTVIAGLRQDAYGKIIDTSTSDEAEQGQDQIVSGMLTAIMSFSDEAFGAGDGGELSTLEFENSQLHLTATPSIMLVVRTIGRPPPKINSLIDERFNLMLTQSAEALGSFDGRLADDASGEVQAQLRRLLREVTYAESEVSQQRHPSKQRSFITFVIALASVIFAALLLIAVLNAFRISGNVSRVQQSIDIVDGLQSYPIEAGYERDKASVVVRGLVPDAASAGLLETRLRENHPRLALSFALSNIATDAVRPILRGSRIEREANSASVNELRDEAFIRDTIIMDLEQQISDLRSALAGTNAVDAAQSYPALTYDIDPALGAMRDRVGNAIVQVLRVNGFSGEPAMNLETLIAQAGADATVEEVVEQAIAGTLIGFTAAGSFTDVRLARETTRLVAELTRTQAKGARIEILAIVRPVTGREAAPDMGAFMASKARALLVAQGLHSSRIEIRTRGRALSVGEINPADWRQSHYVGFRLAY